MAAEELFWVVDDINIYELKSDPNKSCRSLK